MGIEKGSGYYRIYKHKNTVLVFKYKKEIVLIIECWLVVFKTRNYDGNNIGRKAVPFSGCFGNKRLRKILCFK